MSSRQRITQWKVTKEAYNKHINKEVLVWKKQIEREAREMGIKSNYIEIRCSQIHDLCQHLDYVYKIYSQASIPSKRLNKATDRIRPYNQFIQSYHYEEDETPDDCKSVKAH
ncbi:hypothetical protein RclHR1_06250014 [Rhizophagus clarus]|uniref:Uncharacterized protein n=1 Tax=Rhizophagus clarus TaxID=94130 RepID=A0A2Z6S9A7_9GLOM|nr:hypothetical protein RclHR1_06250014 [Rhizophagus clarus]GES97382.1 hypothetical protein RCL_jg8565.t1 [Rhizophagus clarus]